MYSKAEQPEYINSNTDAGLVQIDLEQNEQRAVEVTPPAPVAANKYNLFYTAVNTSLSQAACFSIGAAIRNHPVQKGAITALTGGVIAGAIIGLIGESLGIKVAGNSFKLALCSVLLEWATLSALPLGAQVVPFQQNLPIPTLIEDMLVGSAVLVSPVIAALLLLPCCLLHCYSQLSSEERADVRQNVSQALRKYFGTIDLILTTAESASIEDAPVVIIDPEVADNLSINIPAASMI